METREERPYLAPIMSAICSLMDQYCISVHYYKKAIIDLMSEKKFDVITIQDLSDRANVSRGTIYLHYMDKYDLLDKLIEEHINELRVLCRSAAELDFIGATFIWTEYFENNYSFFSMMLASKGAPYFRNRFLIFLHEEFRNEVNVS